MRVNIVKISNGITNDPRNNYHDLLTMFTCQSGEVLFFCRSLCNLNNSLLLRTYCQLYESLLIMVLKSWKVPNRHYSHNNNHL
jgi:hypothetical protein